jgi:hypothetical protein
VAGAASATAATNASRKQRMLFVPYSISMFVNFRPAHAEIPK